MQQIQGLWQKPSSDFAYELLFSSEVTKLGKKESIRTLIWTQKHLIMKKNDKVKILPLTFTTKFEIIREAPIMKSNPSLQKKATIQPPQGRADIVKPEDVQTLGTIILIRLSSENLSINWDFTCDQQTLIKWRQLMGSRINQIGFHHLFKVFKKIGKGNFASVYLAERLDDGQQMAIKAFSKQAVYAEENGKEGLINEITLMRELDHPNIMKLYEVYESQNSLYMGLELLQGGQLYEYMKKKVIFQNKEIQIIMKGLIRGLAYMHSKGIMHRDLKLENILFKESNNINSVVIADFGLATYVNEPIYLYCRCGTPGFVAPEVININDMKTTYDSVCDVYSLGLVFHILLTGKPGFPGRSYNTIVQQNKEAKINFKSALFDIVQPDALELLKSMLEPNPSKRMKASECLKNHYIRAAEDDDCIIENEEDIPHLDERIHKINQEANKFDMLRIHQLTNSPIKSPVMQATNRMKQVQSTEQHDEMIMRTPVITGRIQSIESSPMSMGNQFTSPSVQLKSAFNKYQFINIRQSSVLDKYAQKPNQQQLQKVPEAEEKETKNMIKNIKSVLNKNL